MSKPDYLKNAIDTLRKMERDGHTPAELCNEFDRFVREQIFGKYKIELTDRERGVVIEYYLRSE